MSDPDRLDVIESYLIETITMVRPGWPKGGFEDVLDRIERALRSSLPYEPIDVETWGTDADAVAGLRALEALVGPPAA